MPVLFEHALCMRWGAGTVRVVVSAQQEEPLPIRALARPPRSGLLGLVCRARKSARGCADRLPVHRIERRHQSRLTDLLRLLSATDEPMTNEELSEAPGRILRLPTMVGAVVARSPWCRTEGRLSRWRAARRYLLGRSEAGTTGDRTIERRRTAAVDGHHRCLPVGQLRFIVHLLATSCRRSLPNGTGLSARQRPGPAARRRAPRVERMAALVKQVPGSIGYLELVSRSATGSIWVWFGTREGSSFVRGSNPAAAAGAAALECHASRLPSAITSAPGKEHVPDLVVHMILLYESDVTSDESQLIVSS